MMIVPQAARSSSVREEAEQASDRVAQDEGGAGGLGQVQDRLLTVAECLATRLCHDVAGLIATVSGTLEMALDDMETESEAATLAQEAAGQLAARVRLYRAAWGGGDMEGDGVTGLAEGLPNRARLNLALDPALSDGRLPRDGGRVLLCVLLAATAGMPRGGDITAAASATGFSVLLGGKQAAWPARIAVNASELEQSLHDADARGLAAPMAALVAAATRWRLSVDGLRLTASG
jgi:hypothetical protein